MYKSIPDETISRLFPYFRALLCLQKQGMETVSSAHLAEVCHVNPAKIRKDLSYFGELGTRGVGYNVKDLMQIIRTILNLDPVKKAALVGVGNIGRALLGYPNFELEGFTIHMVFDNNSDLIGQRINGIIVENVETMRERITLEKIQLGILTVPELAAPTMARQMAKAGVKAILSFAPCPLAMPENIEVTCVDLSSEMAKLIYYSSR